MERNSGDFAAIRQLAGCSSAQEFRLKAEVLGAGWAFPLGFEQFKAIMDFVDDSDGKYCDRWLNVIAECIDLGYFDAALAETVLYQDYYVAAASGEKPDPKLYARYALLDYLLTSYSFTAAMKWRNSTVSGRIIQCAISRIRAAFGDSPTLRNAAKLADRYFKARK